MKVILILIASGGFSFILMPFTMLLYGEFEKLVHKMDKKEMTEQQLEKRLYLISFFIALFIFIVISMPVPD